MDALLRNHSQSILMDVNTTAPEKGLNGALLGQVIVMIIIDLAAICGNASVMFIIIRTPQLRSLSHLFVLNLCLVDLLAATLVLPVSIATVVLGRWVFGNTFCHVNGFFNAFCAFTSISTLGVISIDRYFSIAKPMVYAAKMTLPRVVICIGCIWVQSGALSMAPLLGWNEFYFNPNRAHCSFSWNKEGYHIFYVAMIGVLCFALPAVIVISMYCGIFRVARKAARQVGPLPAVNTEPGQSAEESTGTENRQERGVRFSEDRTTNSTANENNHADAKPHCCRPFNGEFKALKTLLLIVGTFLLLWSPYFAVHIHGIIYRQIGDALIWERVTAWIAYCSFAVNPYVYGWLNKLLRQELIKTFRNCSRCRENATSDAEEQIGEGEDFYQFLERTSTRTTSLYTRSTDMGREQSVAPIKIVEVSEIENN